MLKKLLIICSAILVIALTALGVSAIISWNENAKKLDTKEKKYAYYVENKERFKDAVNIFLENSQLEVITSKKENMVANSTYSYAEPLPGIFVQADKAISNGWLQSITLSSALGLIADKNVVTEKWEYDILNNYQCIAFYYDKEGAISSGWVYVINGFKPTFDNVTVTEMDQIDDCWYVFKTEAKKEK